MLQAEVSSKEVLPNLHFFAFEILAACSLSAKAVLSKGCISLCLFIYQNLVNNWNGKERFYLYVFL